MNSGKRTIINDPIYGFVEIPSGLIFDVIEHPFFQRLRRIRQLGLTHLVYPGAHHTRFHHALGAMHLMNQAIEVLRNKGQNITEEEAVSVKIAILLHDIGHGPFSHTLEESLLNAVHHEKLSELFMERMNEDFRGRLSLAIKIFRDQYSKKFLHQLVSGQLDMDRLDYLNRDSFFTGVSEGVISSDRILKMLDVRNDELVIEHKGIYSIEKFIVSRRLMYWQVYLHKTVVSAENLLVNILRRAKELFKSGRGLFATPSLLNLLSHDYSFDDFSRQPELLNIFASIDDSDVSVSLKVWMKHEDRILSDLCRRLVNRKLFKISIQNEPFTDEAISKLMSKIKSKLNLSDSEINYYLLSGSLINSAYITENEKINILYPDGKLLDIAEAADSLNIKVLSKPVEKYYLCFPAIDNI